MQLQSRFEVALYLWDYFYCANTPAPGDERRWRSIEGATGSIRDWEPYMAPRHAADVRLRAARRVRQAARTAKTHIAKLSAAPDTWVTDALTELETLADRLIAELLEPASEVMLH